MEPKTIDYHCRTHPTVKLQLVGAVATSFRRRSSESINVRDLVNSR